jgi:hypothetical protein
MITNLALQTPKRAVSVRTADAAVYRIKPELRAMCRIMHWRYGRRWQLRPFLSNPFAE